MKITNRKALDDFKGSHADAVNQLNAWEAEVGLAQWKLPTELTAQYGSASILKGRHVVFNIGGNKYRLWVQISYKSGIVNVKAIGTHSEYDKWEIGKE
jgi:mRNA interferase HigB